MPTPQNVEDIRSAIYTAISQGVISQEDLDKLAREIIDKKVTEQDIDRVGGDSKAKKYLRELWNKLVDKSQSEIVEMLFSAIQTQGLHLALLLLNLAR